MYNTLSKFEIYFSLVYYSQTYTALFQSTSASFLSYLHLLGSVRCNSAEFGTVL